MQVHTLADFDPIIARNIGHKAAAIAPRTGRMDRDDVAQELSLHLLGQAACYDSGRSSFATFSDRVLTNKARSIARKYRALKRSPLREAFSLDGSASPHPEPDYQRESEVAISVDGRQVIGVDLRHDVALIVSRMPENLKVVAFELTRGTKSAAARKLGISRAAVNRRVIEMQRYFEDPGLRAYL